LRFDEAAMPLLAFGELPDAVLQAFDLCFEGCRMLSQSVIIAEQQGRDDQQRHGQRGKRRQPRACTAQRCQKVHVVAALVLLLPNRMARRLEQPIEKQPF
jgi:hypothetical protein